MANSDVSTMSSARITSGYSTSSRVAYGGSAVDKYGGINNVSEVETIDLGNTTQTSSSSGGFLGWLNDTALPFLGNAANVVGDVIESTGATIATAGLGLVEGVGKFGEALVDTCAIIGTGIDSIGTGLYDGYQAIKGSITGEEWHSATKEMWDSTMSFVANDYVGGAFDSFYDNTSFGNYLKEKSYGFDTTRSISSGLGYAAGIVALTIATFGAGGAVAGAGAAGGAAAAGASSVAVSGTQLAVTAGVAGFGKGAEKAWGDGANLAEGLGYATFSAAWEGLQFYLGAKINGLSPFQSSSTIGNTVLTEKTAGLLNIFTRIGLDGMDSAAESFTMPLLDLLYKDEYTDENGNLVKFNDNDSLIERYSALFDDNGGWSGVGTNFLMGTIGSSIGEANNLSKVLSGMSIGELAHNAFSSTKKIGGLEIAAASKLASAGNAPYVEEGGLFDFLKKDKNVLNAGSDSMFDSYTGRPLTSREIAQVKYINDMIEKQGSAVISLNHSYELTSGVLNNITNPNAIQVQIKTSFTDIYGNYKPKYNANKYIDRITYSGYEARDIVEQLERLQSQIDTSLPIEARARQIHDLIAREYSDYMKEGLSSSEAHKISASLRGLTANNAVGKKGLVCAGYAQLYKELCDRTGITCDYIRGTGITNSGRGGHAWNVVINETGDQIPVDVCWSATSDQNWFGRSAAFARGHIADVDEMFKNFDLDRAGLDTVIKTMDAKYGTGAGFKSLSNFLSDGNIQQITRDGGCRDYISSLGLANIKEYLDELSGQGRAIMKNNVSISGSAQQIANNVPAGQLGQFGIRNLTSYNGSVSEKLGDVVKTMDAKYGTGAGIDALKKFASEGKLTYITSTNGCREYIKGLNIGDILNYLEGR